MKKNLLNTLFFSCLLLGLGLNACNNAKKTADDANVEAKEEANKYFGKKISADEAMPIAKMLTAMNTANETETAAKITGTIESVCKVKGCWMTLKKDDGSTMRVTFKDYGFFVPKDCDGKTAVVEGIAKVDTVSVDMLRHYAEDEGLPKEEIEKITEPEIDVSFVADGVIIL